ncbi:hypothetical protein [Bradyrhizobium sp. AUGA SZCCT0283]|uniref:hypothetical protein n=1 Tax=Bradyrhizobium sp. AUGA SZCCT0283 TaxID=2807671 RepID=UPI001BA95B3E|nr:hypothetical protein [Bradyrhizobium sp. AUGA SZCCT0283]MBR1278992.1 hypothetical protein [Bradyrhizobium sp. AUGA SZCCT0283]
MMVFMEDHLLSPCDREGRVMGDNKAFLATPYQEELRWVRNAIASACRRLNIELISVDEQVAAGDVIAGIHQYVRSSDFGYVVITGLNANVMYELGLLHQAGKPTIILSDADTAVPFDLRSAMRLEYDAQTKDEARLTDQVAAVTGQLLRFFDQAERTAIVSGVGRSPTLTAQDIGASVFRVAEFEFEDIKNRAARAMGRTGCATSNIMLLDEGSFRGWRLKAKCAGGSTLIVKVDLNGEAFEIDVQE